MICWETASSVEAAEVPKVNEAGMGVVREWRQEGDEWRQGRESGQRPYSWTLPLEGGDQKSQDQEDMGDDDPERHCAETVPATGKCPVWAAHSVASRHVWEAKYCM